VRTKFPNNYMGTSEGIIYPRFYPYVSFFGKF